MWIHYGTISLGFALSDEDDEEEEPVAVEAQKEPEDKPPTTATSKKNAYFVWIECWKYWLF